MTPAQPVMPEPTAPPEEKENASRGGRKRGLLVLLLLLLLVCSGCVWLYYLTTRQPLINALPPARAAAKGFQPHYLFSIYGIAEPVGVAVTPDGERIYVAESGGERLLHAFDRDGKKLFTFAPPNTQPAGRSPVFIALDPAGQVYVSDRIKNSVDVYDAGGNFKNSLKPLTLDGWAPLGLRFDGTDLVLTEVTQKKHRVLVMNKDGQVTTQFGREGQGTRTDELSFPNSAIVDARGRIYVSDSNNGRVQVFDKGGNLLYTIPGFSLPRGLAIDADERLYVVDIVGQTVKVFDASKEKAESLFSFGDLGVGDSEFNYPNDIALDKTDRLYIADRVNNRVQVWVY